MTAPLATYQAWPLQPDRQASDCTGRRGSDGDSNGHWMTAADCAPVKPWNSAGEAGLREQAADSGGLAAALTGPAEGLTDPDLSQVANA